MQGRKDEFGVGVGGRRLTDASGKRFGAEVDSCPTA